MTAGKRTAPALAVRCHRGERVKDEVYRQMFRLEESRPGAELGLALALLRAWLAAGCNAQAGAEKDWLTKVSTICLEMIEASLQKGSAAGPCLQ